MFRPIRKKKNEDMVNEKVAFAGMGIQMFEIKIEHFSGKEIQER